MTPSLRPLQHLLQITTLWWGSRPRPRHAFQIQLCLSYSNTREEREFPYCQTTQSSQRHKELLRGLRFPRKRWAIYDKISWLKKWTPPLLKRLIIVGRRYPWRKQNPRFVATRNIGHFFFHFITHDKQFFTLLDMTILPWGCISKNSGTSMQPTFSGNPSISYNSYIFESRDVSIGDVVGLLDPEYDASKTILGKRIAAVEGDRILEFKGSTGAPKKKTGISLLFLYYTDKARILLRSWG